MTALVDGREAFTRGTCVRPTKNKRSNSEALARQSTPVAINANSASALAILYQPNGFRP